ncbi:hypothetical protein EHS25_005043 [Saitozyma podzolica]|uniref:sulfiredoxin n=1 Tax=Saitozyma podzolica TaxID=1890683 RepID=A0A427Y260_9TREE|nr:hypothetical protein EHS25_005043 [Saitozyma podzolica]
MSSEAGPSCLPASLLPTSTSSSNPPPAAPRDTPNPSNPTSSIFSRSKEAPVHSVPMSVIHRPLPSELDEGKVKTFMEEMQRGDSFTPIEVVKVRAPLKVDPTNTPQNFYFAMGGCHRYEATKRLGWETIRARIIEVPASQMRVYLGAGSPF